MNKKQFTIERNKKGMVMEKSIMKVLNYYYQEVYKDQNIPRKDIIRQICDDYDLQYDDLPQTAKNIYNGESFAENFSTLESLLSKGITPFVVTEKSLFFYSKNKFEVCKRFPKTFEFLAKKYPKL